MNTIPKVYRFGETLTAGILNGPVVVQEKYDGSQFSFGILANGGMSVWQETQTKGETVP